MILRPPMPPRDWQPKAYTAVLDAVRGGEAPLVSACTGSGKSWLIGALAQAASTRGSVVIATPSQMLVRQLAETLEAWCPGKVGQFYADRKDHEAPILVTCNASLPTLPKRDNLRVLLSDEAHKSETELFKAAVSRLAPAHLVAVTATPYRGDERNISLFSRCVFRYTMTEATRDRVLVPLVRRWWNGSAHDAQNLDAVCLSMMRTADGPGVVDAVSIDDAEKFSTYLNANGFDAAAVHSKLPADELPKRMKQLLYGEIRCVVHVSMLVEGVDYPWLRWLCGRRPVNSIGRLVQSIGRVVRSAPLKTEATYFDVHDTFKALGIDHADGIGLAEALDKAAEREACGPSLIPAPILLPPAVAVDELQQWARLALLALVEAGVAEAPAGGSWRAGWATERQIGALRNMDKLARWLPEGPREAIRCVKNHTVHLTAGQASDMIDLLKAAGDANRRAQQRHGTNWMAVHNSIKKRLATIPVPPADAVQALLRKAA